MDCLTSNRLSSKAFEYWPTRPAKHPNAKEFERHCTGYQRPTTSRYGSQSIEKHSYRLASWFRAQSRRSERSGKLRFMTPVQCPQHCGGLHQCCIRYGLFESEAMQYYAMRRSSFWCGPASLVRMHTSAQRFWTTVSPLLYLDRVVSRSMDMIASHNDQKTMLPTIE